MKRKKREKEWKNKRCLKKKRFQMKLWLKGDEYVYIWLYRRILCHDFDSRIFNCIIASEGNMNIILCNFQPSDWN